MKRPAAILCLFALTGCRQGPPPAPNIPFVVHDIKGDVLGMSLADYKKSHPDTCPAATPGFCMEHTTYAGYSASKYASFTGDKLYKVEYALHLSEITSEPEKFLAALQEKFGPPHGEEQKMMLWKNPSVTMTYFHHIKDEPVLTFIANDLRDAAEAEHREQKKQDDAARKKDM
jgi:hypothetical protein